MTEQMKVLMQQERNPISPISLISNSEENLVTLESGVPPLTLTSCESLKPKQIQPNADTRNEFKRKSFGHIYRTSKLQ
jgi:hypothetical protein